MPPQPRNPRPENRGALVIGARPVDAIPTDPPPGYTPGAQLTQTEQGTLTPGQEAVREADRLDAAAPAGANPAAANNGVEQTTPPADDSARNAQKESKSEDAQAEEPAEQTYASDNQVQAARLVVRAYARQRDGVAPKARAAAAALAELRQMGGSREQLAMVLADARVKPRELGLKADGSPAS